MRRLAMLAMLVMAGCDGDADPAAGPLPPGSEATTYNDPRNPAFEGIDRSNTINVVSLEVGKVSSLPGMTIELVDVGTRVRVADDPGPASDGRRAVRVRVLEGPHADLVGTIPRDNLRPIPR